MTMAYASISVSSLLNNTLICERIMTSKFMMECVLELGFCRCCRIRDGHFATSEKGEIKFHGLEFSDCLLCMFLALFREDPLSDVQKGVLM
jgi:hypothetical protein